MSYFLIDICTADFGWKDINRKAHTRLLNGKLIPVKNSRYRLENLRKGLSELRNITKDEIEAGALFNPKTGKLSNVIIGNERSVDLNFLAPKSKFDITTGRTTIHNHPDDSLIGLSLHDIVTSKLAKENMGIAVDQYGEYRVSFNADKPINFINQNWDADKNVRQLNLRYGKIIDNLNTYPYHLNENMGNHWLNQNLASKNAGMNYRYKWHNPQMMKEFLNTPSVKLTKEKTLDAYAFVDKVVKKDFNFADKKNVFKKMDILHNFISHFDTKEDIDYFSAERMRIVRSGFLKDFVENNDTQKEMESYLREAVNFVKNPDQRVPSGWDDIQLYDYSIYSSLRNNQYYGRHLSYKSHEKYQDTYLYNHKSK